MVSGGRVNLGGGTSRQRAHGIEDSADAIYEDWLRHEPLLNRYADRELARGDGMNDVIGQAAISVGDINITGKHKAQGSAWYMSPEQINQDPDIDYRTDVFSLGAVLYEALCGKPPAQGEKPHQIIESVLKDTPPPPSEVASIHVPRLLEQVAMRCLEKDPGKRFASMGDMVRALRQDWQSDLI